MIHLAASLACLLALAPPAPAQVKYTDAQVGWSMTLPEGLRQDNKRGGGKGRVAFFAPKEGSYTPSLFILSGDIGTESAETLGKASIAQSLKEKGVKLVQRIKITIGGAPGYAWLLARTMPNGLVIGQRQVIVVRNGRGAVFTLSAPKESITEWDAAFVKSLKTFRWTK